MAVTLNLYNNQGRDLLATTQLVNGKWAFTIGAR